MIGVGEGDGVEGFGRKSFGERFGSTGVVADDDDLSDLVLDQRSTPFGYGVPEFVLEEKKKGSQTRRKEGRNDRSSRLTFLLPLMAKFFKTITGRTAIVSLSLSRELISVEVSCEDLVEERKTASFGEARSAGVVLSSPYPARDRSL